jgi:peptide/nickel transport system substrate-binding protein
MKKIWNIFMRVLKAFTLEERVLSLVFLVLMSFFTFRAVLFLINPMSAFADSGIFTEGVISSKPILINPLYTDFSQANRDVSALVFSGLLKYDPKLMAFVDDLASLKVEGEGKEYLCTLRDGVLWHDGEPLTIDDVMFTFEYIQNPEFQNSLIKANFQGVKIEKVDEKTVKFVLSSPNSFFVSNLNVGILPKHLLSDIAVSDLPVSKFNLQPVGTGPYRVLSPVEFANDGKQKVALKQFIDYYSVKPTITEIRFTVYPDEQMLLKDKASINIVSRVSGQVSELVYDERWNTEGYTLPQYTAVFFNTESDVLKKSKMRIALLKLVNKEELMATLDNKIRVDTPLMELNQEEWLNKPDLNEANGALFDSGYKFKKDDDGEVLEDEVYRRGSDEKELELSLVARQFIPGSYQASEIEKTVTYLIEAWKKGGVKINLQMLEEQDYLGALNKKEYDMILAGQSMGYNLDTFTFWHSSQIKEGGLNLSKFMSFAADQQIEKIRETFDKDDKQEREEKLAEIISNEVPAVFLYRPSYLLLTDGKVKNIKLSNLSYESDRFVNISDWCIGKEC